MLLRKVDGAGMDGDDLVRQIELVREQRRLPVERIAAIHRDGPGLRLLEAAEQREERGLPHPVLSQESVDIALGHLQGDVFQYALGAVTEGKIADFDHIVCVY